MLSSKLKLSLLLAFLAATSLPCQAALTAAVAWEVRPTVGTDTNGCGYTTGTTATTTDYSQNNNKNAAACSNCGSSTQDLSTTDSVANGTTTITSATANFVAAKGNVVRFNGGTGAIAAVRRNVVSVTNTTTIVLDAAIAASTGMTMNIGGSCALITETFTSNIASNKIFVKASGTLTITANQTLNNTLAPSSTIPPNQLIGYTSTRTDAGRVAITLSTNTGLIAIDAGVGGWYIRNFTIDCASLGTSTGINLGEQSMAINVKVSNCTSQGVLFTSTTQASIVDSEVTACTSACTAAINTAAANSIVALRNWIHDNVSSGIILPVRSTFLFNLVSNNSGASSDGVRFAAGGQNIFNNTIYLNGRDGIRDTGNVLPSSVNIRNNLLVSNVGAGITGGGVAGSAAYPQYDGNAYFSNGSTRVSMDDVGATNAINGAAPYVNVLDVTSAITCDPFKNAVGNDFSLNQLACGGLAVRQAGTPGPVGGAGSTTTGNNPIGVAGTGALASGGFCAIHN